MMHHPYTYLWVWFTGLTADQSGYEIEICRWESVGAACLQQLMQQMVGIQKRDWLNILSPSLIG